VHLGILAAGFYLRNNIGGIWPGVMNINSAEIRH